MNLSEYPSLAIVTESVVPEIDGKDSRVRHSLMGIFEESAEIMAHFTKRDYHFREIDKIKLVEEVGDICWFLAILCDVEKIDFGEEVDHVRSIIEDKNVHKNEVHILADLGSCATRGLISFIEDRYNPMLVESLFYLINKLIVSFDTNWENVCEKNIAKLKSRYGTKFDAQKSINRDVEREREVLKQVK